MTATHSRGHWNSQSPLWVGMYQRVLTPSRGWSCAESDTIPNRSTPVDSCQLPKPLGMLAVIAVIVTCTS